MRQPKTESRVSFRDFIIVETIVGWVTCVSSIFYAFMIITSDCLFFLFCVKLLAHFATHTWKVA